MNKVYKILGSRWFVNIDGCMGIVAIQTGLHDPDRFEWKAFLGRGFGYVPADDEQHIAAWGNSLSPQEAHGFFPDLDIDAYKKE